MNMLSRVRDRLLERAAAGLRVKTVSMKNTRPIVSFTFDDFPRSAAQCAGSILERHDMRGTFYAAGLLCGKTIDGIAYYQPSDIAALNEAGHEIACHTFAHVRVSSLNATMLAGDITKNADYFHGDYFREQRLPDLQNFSYPFGGVSPAAKRTLQRRFESCRGIQPGINFGTADLGLLRATSVYGTKAHPRTAGLVDQVAAKNGWLIFYTHDVADAPSQYGCTPAVFEDLVGRVAKAGVAVLTIREAVAAIRG
jgi:peptidoglycan/xylan/chitin deacetylase (PgdA/CDA1 family)